MSSARVFSGISLTLLVAAALTLVGCPDDGVIKDGLVIVDDVPLLDVEQICDDIVAFFSGLDSPFEAGDIVIGSDEGGFLRRILAVGENGTEVITQTEDASLCEVVDNGLLLKNFEFSSADLANAGIVTDGALTIIDVSGMDIYRDYGIAITIVNGTIDCAPDVNIAATFDNHRLDTFALTASCTTTLNLDISVAVDAQTPLNFETDIIPPITHPFAASIGPIPVYGVATLRLPFGVTAQFDGETSVQSGFDVSNTFTVGAEYASGQWDSMTDWGGLDFNGHPLTWSIDIGADVTVYVRAILSVSLYEAADLSVFAKPYMTADINIVPSPANILLLAGIDFGASYGVRIFDWQIAGDSFYWTGPSGVILDWTSDSYEDDWSQGSWDFW